MEVFLAELVASYGIAALAAIAIPVVARRLGCRLSHLINMAIGGAGLERTCPANPLPAVTNPGLSSSPTKTAKIRSRFSGSLPRACKSTRFSDTSNTAAAPET